MSQQQKICNKFYYNLKWVSEHSFYDKMINCGIYNTPNNNPLSYSSTSRQMSSSINILLTSLLTTYNHYYCTQQILHIIHSILYSTPILHIIYLFFLPYSDYIRHLLKKYQPTPYAMDIQIFFFFHLYGLL